ncbi:MAG TPA: thiamine ABC transporter substrate-binding protein [Candidatus Thermoplasmatota archaeon]|nr:thiamine ABC transporter substrate-binding protein [Candidatus Thermoplasmatota archaeon]
MRIALIVLLLTPALAGCSTPPPGSDGERTRTLTVLTHESYLIDDAVIAAFERASGAEVSIVTHGDSGAVLNEIILTKDNPLADVVFGIDNALAEKAKAAGILVEYRPQGWETIRSDLVFDPDWELTPNDYGYVQINYDKAALEARGLAPPERLEDLTNATWKGLLVVEHPATSSPGLAFLLATVARFGADEAFDWWRAMESNDVVVAAGWSEAYFTQFAGGGTGDVPMVVSYATSPPYAAWEACKQDGVYIGLERCRAERPEAVVLPTENVDVPEGAWLQIEGIGILKGAKEPELARAFIDFTLTKDYQASLATSNFVWPAVEGAAVPDFFALVSEPDEPATLPGSQLAEKNLQAWTDAWSEIFQ